MTAAVTFQNVSRHFGTVRAVDDVDLEIVPGEFFAMLGPSGSGKTTCLRLIAGFEQPTAGHIEIFGETAEGVPPYRRNVNTVFQDYALFPHLNVVENVAYGLMVRGVGKAERRKVAEEALELVQLPGYGARRPGQLSGGQRQRVALARALVNKPKVLLLDEPLGALDLKLREQMQEELKALQKRLAITFVFVTHDQGEALSMADRIAVFNEGRIMQTGSPEEIYQRPQSRFVADFVGSSNVLPPAFVERHAGQKRWASLRPESVRIGNGADGGHDRNGGRLQFPRRLDAHRSRGRGPAVARGAARLAAGARRGRDRLAQLGTRAASSDGRGAMNSPAAVSTNAILPGRGGLFGQLADVLWRRPGLLLLIMLAPPVLWLGVIYLGSLFALLAQSFFSIDEFSGLINYELTLKTYGELFRPSNMDIILRSVSMAAVVTLAAAIVAFPIAYYAARYARGKWKALFYLGAMLPLWSSYLVKVYAWKLILAKEGILTWLFTKLHLMWLLELVLAIPVIGGNSLSVSYTGTFLVFLYVWLPFMILPTQAALERVPVNLIEASSDLGAAPGQTFRTVLLPLALPGMVAGSIFTFSLTLGDYIIPQIVGSSRLFIGQAVYAQQGTAGNIPLAAAFTVVPIVIMGFYLWGAKRLGAFDAL